MINKFLNEHKQKIKTKMFNFNNNNNKKGFTRELNLWKSGKYK